MTDGRPDRRIITNPCNLAAEANNLAAIQEALGDLYNSVENINEIINIEEITNNFGGDGDDIFPFRITVATSTTQATVQNLDTGETMTVIDWTTRNLFGCNFAAGNEGWAVRRQPAEDGTPSTIGDIVILEGFARWAVVTLLGPLSGGTASGTTGSQYWGGYTNKRQPPGTVTVHDIIGLCSAAQTGEKVLCVLDDKDGCRYVAVACVSNTAPEVNSCLVQINGPACQDLALPGNCLYDGTLLTGTSGSGDACSYGFTNAGNVWVIDARNCLPKSVKGNERYIACKVANNWTNGATSRPLWAIVSESSSRLVCVRFEKASSGDDYVNPASSCIYNGFLVSTNAADPCVQTPGEAVWIAANVPSGCKVEDKHVSFGIIVKDEHTVGDSTRKLVFAKPQYVCKAVFAQAYSTGNFCSDTETVGIESLTVDGRLEGPLRTPFPYDIVLTDMQMPELDGYATVRLLREKGCGAPLIALTAFAMQGSGDECLSVGCDDYLSKPLTRDALLAVCSKWRHAKLSHQGI
jgi:CheY-like chemotaxis protein